MNTACRIVSVTVPSVDVSVNEQRYSILHVDEQELVDDLAIHAEDVQVILYIVKSI